MCGRGNLDFHVAPQRSLHERRRSRETDLTVLKYWPSPLPIVVIGEGIEGDSPSPGLVYRAAVFSVDQARNVETDVGNQQLLIERDRRP